MFVISTLWSLSLKPQLGTTLKQTYQLLFSDFADRPVLPTGRVLKHATLCLGSSNRMEPRQRSSDGFPWYCGWIVRTTTKVTLNDKLCHFSGQAWGKAPAKKIVFFFTTKTLSSTTLASPQENGKPKDNRRNPNACQGRQKQRLFSLPLKQWGPQGFCVGNKLIFQVEMKLSDSLNAQLTACC